MDRVRHDVRVMAAEHDKVWTLGVYVLYVRTPHTNTRTGQLDTSRAFGGGAQLIPKVWARIEPRMRVAPPWPLRVSSSSHRSTNYYRFLLFFPLAPVL